jgi:PAS domain S-box-containing protein
MPGRMKFGARRTMRGFVLATASITILIAILGASLVALVARERETAREQAVLRAGFLAQSFADHASRTLDMTALLVQFMTGEIELGRLSGRSVATELPPPVLDRLASLTQSRGIAVYSAEGELTLQVAGQRAVFEEARATLLSRHRGAGLDFTITPIGGDPQTGVGQILLSQRIDEPDSRFGGLVAVSLNPQGFRDFYEAGAPVGVDAVALLDSNGSLIAQWASGRAVPTSETRTAFQLAGAGGRGAAWTDDTLVAWYQLRDFPFSVVVAAGPGIVERRWSGDAVRYGLMLGLLALGAAVSLGLIHRQLRRRADADALLQGFIANPPLIMSLRDASGRYLMANPRFCTVFGVDEAAIVGKRPSEVFPGRRGARMDWEFDETVAAGRAVTFDVRTETSEGERDLLVLRFPIYDGDRRLLGVGTVSIDMTERKQAEEGLRRSEANLRRQAAELELLSQDNVRQREVAEMANRAKSEFLAHMSHELRTPLNAIIGFGEIIEKQIYGARWDKYGAYAEDIRRSGQHLLGVINDILDVSKIESGRYSISRERASLHDLVDSCLRLVRARATENHVRLDDRVPADLPPIQVDQQATKQVLLNLLSNALKFTPAGGTVTVEAETGADGTLVLRVRDSGAGIEPDHLGRIFEPFWHSASRIRHNSEGTGLGLTISKKLMELQGGDITIESEVGRGTVATISFPRGTLLAAPAA